MVLDCALGADVVVGVQTGGVMAPALLYFPHLLVESQVFAKVVAIELTSQLFVQWHGASSDFLSKDLLAISNSSLVVDVGVEKLLHVCSQRCLAT